MRYIVDAQLPRQLCTCLQRHGFDAMHTLDLPKGNRTTDQEVAAVALAHERVVVSKDFDFVHMVLRSGKPIKLLLIALGNMRNAELIAALDPHLPDLDRALQDNRIIEIDMRGIHILY